VKISDQQFPAVKHAHNGLLHFARFDKVEFSKLKKLCGAAWPPRKRRGAWLKIGTVARYRKVMPVGKHRRS